MLNLILGLFSNGFSAFATSYGLYGVSTSFNLISKPNYSLNLGITNITYKSLSQNYLDFNFNYSKSSFSIQIIGSVPLNHNLKYVSRFR